MGKFDGILLCSDLDETLLMTDKSISAENKNAIERFMAEGGRFTFATGRVPHGAKLSLKYVVPNAPMVCFNGSAIYDFETDKLLWECFLDDGASEVVGFVDKNMPEAGILVCANESTYYCKSNSITREHQYLENMPDNNLAYTDITEKWKKVIFMVPPEKIPQLRQLIAESEYADKYNFIQSYQSYYELLPKNTGKGEAMLELAKILGINPKYTVGVGDNENDLSLVKLAGIGIAVANAVDAVLDAADYITVDNNSHALRAVIDGIETGKIRFA